MEGTDNTIFLPQWLSALGRPILVLYKWYNKVRETIYTTHVLFVVCAAHIWRNDRMSKCLLKISSDTVIKAISLQNMTALEYKKASGPV